MKKSQSWVINLNIALMELPQILLYIWFLSMCANVKTELVFPTLITSCWFVSLTYHKHLCNLKNNLNHEEISLHILCLNYTNAHYICKNSFHFHFKVKIELLKRISYNFRIASLFPLFILLNWKEQTITAYLSNLIWNYLIDQM